MEKRIIGYTTGVFDLFHIGHLNIIRRAKEQCDYLIVGVSTDELVENYKNKRPVMTFEDRKAIVAALKYVDEVVPQVDRNKFSAWKKYRFHKMFVGDDWKGSALFDEVQERFKEVGVEVIYFPRTDGVSTSELVEKIIKK